MQHKTSHILGAGQLNLFTQSHIPDVDPKANFLIVHGIGEHSDRYPNLVNALVSAGISVFSFDLRGHGRSQGLRGHVNSWDEYRDDVHTMLESVRQANPQLPIFLFGHSLGSLIALDYCLAESKKPDNNLQLSGLVLSGLAVDPSGASTPGQIMMVRVLSSIWPTFSFNNKIEGNWLSAIPSVAEAYSKDPMVSNKRTTRWGAESLKTVDRLLSQVQHLPVSLLLFHGGKDPICSASGARIFFEKLVCDDKEIHVFPESYHEIHNDFDHPKMMEILVQWIEKRL